MNSTSSQQSNTWLDDLATETLGRPTRIQLPPLHRCSSWPPALSVSPKPSPSSELSDIFSLASFESTNTLDSISFSPPSTPPEESRIGCEESRVSLFSYSPPRSIYAASARSRSSASEKAASWRTAIHSKWSRFVDHHAPALRTVSYQIYNLRPVKDAREQKDAKESKASPEKEARMAKGLGDKDAKVSNDTKEKDMKTSKDAKDKDSKSKEKDKDKAKDKKKKVTNSPHELSDGNVDESLSEFYYLRDPSVYRGRTPVIVGNGRIDWIGGDRRVQSRRTASGQRHAWKEPNLRDKYGEWNPRDPWRGINGKDIFTVMEGDDEGTTAAADKNEKEGMQQHRPRNMSKYRKRTVSSLC